MYSKKQTKTIYSNYDYNFSIIFSPICSHTSSSFQISPFIFYPLGTLWIFGGFSMTTGSPLNDIRAFDAKVGTWLPVTVQHDDATPPALPPGKTMMKLTLS
jgi:hypothetical protein